MTKRRPSHVPQIHKTQKNIKLVHGTFQWMMKSNLDQIIIVYDENDEKLIKSIKGTTHKLKRYNIIGDERPIINVQYVPVVDCDSVGDVVRELQEGAFLQEDFLVLENGFVSNQSLDSFILKHSNITKDDKDCLISCCFLEDNGELAGKMSYTSSSMHKNFVTCITSVDHKEKILALRVNRPIVEFESDEPFLMYSKLFPAGLYLCHEGCGNLFVDNFDFKTFESLICSILVDYDILGYNVYQQRLKLENNTNFLKCLPLMSYSIIMALQYNYFVNPERCLGLDTVLDFNVFMKKSVELMEDLEGCKSLRNVAIMPYTNITRPKILTNSFIGKFVKIGNNCAITNCIILDKVEIMENCTIENCIIAKYCTVLENTKLTNCFISEGVIIESGVYSHLQNLILYTLTSTQCINNEIGDDFSQHSNDYTSSPFGSRCNCVQVTPRKRSARNSISSYIETDSDLSESDPEDFVRKQNFSISCFEDVDETDTGNRFVEFSKVLIVTIMESYTDKTNSDNTIIEINSLKHAYSNVHIRDLVRILVAGLFNVCWQLCQVKFDIEDKDTDIFVEFVNIFKNVFLFFEPVLNRYVCTDDTLQTELLEGLWSQFILSAFSPISGTILQVLHHLYNTVDIVDDKFINTWYEEIKKTGEEYKSLVDKVSEFVVWMNQDDDESDETDTSDTESLSLVSSSLHS